MTAVEMLMCWPVAQKVFLGHIPPTASPATSKASLFWTTDGEKVVNYPNSTSNCTSLEWLNVRRFKPSIRVIKICVTR